MLNLRDDFHKSTAQLKKLHEDELLRYAGVEGVKLVKDNFKEQSFDHEENWEPRPDWVNEIYDTNPAYKGSYIKGSNPIAKQTGKLRDSNHFEVTPNKVLIGTNTNLVPYAKTINEGGKSYWAQAGRTINVIARKFLPVTEDSTFINKIWNKAKVKYETRLNQIMSNFRI